MPGPPDPQDLVVRALDGEQRAVAQLISLVENAGPQLREAVAALTPHTGRAHVVGLTGAPGVGKSTMTSALVGELRRRGRRVGVLAVDPSSPFSGGALLGDRVRMGDHAGDDGVFIRSMATRGHLGGLSWATPQALRVLDAAGCDVVLVETVGVGQSEVEIVGLADTAVVLLAPGMGDGVQAAKAGILEIGDVFVVNKADREGARRTVRELRTMLSLRDDHGPGGGPSPPPGSDPADRDVDPDRTSDPGPDADRDPGSGAAGASDGTGGRSWQPPVLATVAARADGVDALADAVDEHRTWAERSGALRERRRLRARTEIEAIGLDVVRSRMEGLRGGAALDRLADRVLDGDLDPYVAADRLLENAADPDVITSSA